MNNCKVSIIVPVYNVEPYVEACLQSVASQTMTEGVECIVVDDCGTDQSMQIAERFVKDYDGPILFRILHHEHNRGLSAARNTGIRAAQGEYVYFLDSDDEMISRCMEMMYSRIENYGGVDLVQGFIYEYEKGQKQLTEVSYDIPEYSEDKSFIKTFLLRYEADIIPAQSRLIRREIFFEHNLFFKEGIIHEDNYWSFFLAKYVQAMGFCKQRTYYHRFNPGSITKSINVEKEGRAYITIVSDLCEHIDPFLKGVQKEYILNNIITAIESGFILSKTEEKEIIRCLGNRCSGIERMLLYLYFNNKSETIMKKKILHALIRIFNINM